MSEAKITRKNLATRLEKVAVLQNERGAKKDFRFDLDGAVAIHGPDIGSSVKVGDIEVKPGEVAIIGLGTEVEVRIVHDPLTRRFVALP